jgi:hypothetical protein
MLISFLHQIFLLFLPLHSYSYVLYTSFPVLIGTVSRDFRFLGFCIKQTHTGILIHGFKPVRKCLQIRENIRQSEMRVLCNYWIFFYFLLAAITAQFCNYFYRLSVVCLLSKKMPLRNYNWRGYCTTYPYKTAVINPFT